MATKHIRDILDYWYQGKPLDGPFQKIWFNATPQQDEEMKMSPDPFGSNLKMNSWIEAERGELALVILLDQLSRNMFRGTSKMFASDSAALEVSKRVIERGMQGYHPSEWMFFCISLQHSENVEDVRRSDEEFKKMVISLEKKTAKRYRPLLGSSKAHLEMIEKFGRYLHRDFLLGRPSTNEEMEYLASKQNNFVRSVIVKEKKVEVESVPAPVPSERRKKVLRVLVLHGFRQNSHIMTKAIKKLSNMLQRDVKFVTVSSPQSYKVGMTPSGTTDVHHPTWDTETQHQRVWWNASADGREYVGWETSVDYLTQVFRREGPFDGCLGFSQGATLIGVLAGLRRSELNFRFAVCISGGPSRADAHKEQQEELIRGLDTLNIYGRHDQHLGTPEEMKQKTVSLSQLFENPTVLEHTGGHFTPNYWPLDEISKFILSHAVPEVDDDVELSGFEAKASASNVSSHQGFHPRGLTKEMKEHIQSNPQMTKDHTELIRYVESLPRPVPASILDDVLLLSFCFRDARKTHVTKGNQYHNQSQVAVWMALRGVDGEYLMSKLPSVVTLSPESWRELQYVAIEEARSLGYSRANPVRDFSTKSTLYREIIQMYCQQLKMDRERMREGLGANGISECAKYCPRMKTLGDELCHMARDIAQLIRPISKEATEEVLTKGKLTAYTGYKKDIAKLTHALDQNNPDAVTLELGKQQLAKMRLTEEERRAVLSQPPNRFVVYPEEVPVVPSTAEALQPLLRHLETHKTAAEEQQAFTKGTILVHKDLRVLDLCKQVVGPQGIEPLLDALIHARPITSLLIGNNITGTTGARAISRYISDSNSQITTWYIAGNRFRAADLAMICAPLVADEKVKALWLKRNPLGPDAAPFLSHLLYHNTCLTTLDLANCGMLDEGMDKLYEGLHRNRTLRHLYLNTNGLSVSSADKLSRVLENGSHIESLYLSINPLGDEGIISLSKGIAVSPHIKRLGLSSCAIGISGVTALVDALLVHKKIESLNLGFLKGTYLFNGLCNYLEEEGAKVLADRLIPNCPSLRLLDVCHNSIPPAGIRAILSAVEDAFNGEPITSDLYGSGIVSLPWTQFGQQSVAQVEELKLKEVLRRNEKRWAEKVHGEGCDWRALGAELTASVEAPPHAAEIISVYRTKD
ncbi:leucine-rich repeat, ribonuclease inhibitor subtype [Planoprotostelium fungivorum]|uniref:Leucine-rich repeat, ribonuclease inhibitor subtype n=1 Tax=Planoprotostelium fungivorum TaxID=1890364 RepID=A0A2P6P0K6_9EUKA|nr:leucine-rich repeat, ribonuclease inhibitor subtype [Planoprotostelium fungivorum]